MNYILLTPPLAFAIFVLLSFGVSRLSALFTYAGKEVDSKYLAYACGEDVMLHKVQPNFSQFFPFAFFFTVMHIITLIITTVPKGVPALAIVYIAVAFLSIFILYKR